MHNQKGLTKYPSIVSKLIAEGMLCQVKNEIYLVDSVKAYLKSTSRRVIISLTSIF